MTFSILLLPAISLNAFAVPVLVTNHSFEDPILANGDSTNSATGWILSDSVVINPSFFVDNIDGNNLLSLQEDDSSLTPGTAKQTVTTVAPDTRYTFTFDSYDPIRGNVFVSIKANDVAQTGKTVFVLFSPSILLQPFSISWDSPSSGPLIGQSLEIEFSKIIGDVGTLDDPLIDNVRLDATHLSEIDDDGDGVSNIDDLCPGQDDLLDTDSDGIPNCLDPEPNLGCGPGTTQVDTLCLPIEESGLTCGFGTQEVNGQCESIIQCGAGTFLDGNVCTLLEQCEALGSMIGGALLDIDTTALLVASIGTNPVITSLIGITIAGIAGQSAWFIHQRRKTKN